MAATVPAAASRAATTCAELDAWICKLRVDLAPDNGAAHIRDALAGISAHSTPGWAVPSRSTINRVLARYDLPDRNSAKRPRSSWRRFTYARPRYCYQIDATEVILTDVACHAAQPKPPTPRSPKPRSQPARQPER